MIRITHTINTDAAESIYEVVLDAIKNKGLPRAAQDVATAEKHAAPKAFGQLVASIRAHRLDDLRWAVTPGGTKPLKYAEYVEYGSKAGNFPPVAHILTWLRTKGIAPNNPDMTEQDLAFLIARGIYHRGQKANPFIKNTADTMRPRVHTIINDAIAKAVAT